MTDYTFFHNGNGSAKVGKLLLKSNSSLPLLVIYGKNE